MHHCNVWCRSFHLFFLLIVIVCPIPGKSTNVNEPFAMPQRKLLVSIQFDSTRLRVAIVLSIHARVGWNKKTLSQPLSKQLSRKSTPCIICACSFHFWNWNRVEKALVIDCVRVFVYVSKCSNFSVCTVHVCVCLREQSLFLLWLAKCVEMLWSRDTRRRSRACFTTLFLCRCSVSRFVFFVHIQLNVEKNA